MNMVLCTLVFHFVMFDEGGWVGGWVGGGVLLWWVVSGEWWWWSEGSGRAHVPVFVVSRSLLSSRSSLLSLSLLSSLSLSLYSLSSLLFSSCVGVCVSLFAYLCTCKYMFKYTLKSVSVCISTFSCV